MSFSFNVKNVGWIRKGQPKLSVSSKSKTSKAIIFGLLILGCALLPISLADKTVSQEFASETIKDAKDFSVGAFERARDVASNVKPALESVMDGLHTVKDMSLDAFEGAHEAAGIIKPALQSASDSFAEGVKIL